MPRRPGWSDVSLFGIDVPIVFLDLGANPFFPAPADHPAFLRVGEPASPAGAQAIRSVLRTLRRIEVQIFPEAIEGFQPAAVREGHRRFGPMINLKRIGRAKRNMEGAAAFPGLLWSAPYGVASRCSAPTGSGRCRAGRS